MTTKEALNIVLTTLKSGVDGLPQNEKLKVEIPESVEDYRLSHPNGALLVVYRGSEYNEAGVKGYVAQKRDMEIGVIIIARRKTSGKTPEEYIDFVLDTLSGIIPDGLIFNNSKVRALSDEWIKEENGVWFYAVTFLFPNDFKETSL
jgi:hypothetical protein